MPSNEAYWPHAPRHQLGDARTYMVTSGTYQKIPFFEGNIRLKSLQAGLALEAVRYPWCSAAWLERTATPAQVKTIYSFPIDQLRILDDY